MVIMYVFTLNSQDHVDSIQFSHKGDRCVFIPQPHCKNTNIFILINYFNPNINVAVIDYVGYQHKLWSIKRTLCKGEKSCGG